MSKKSAIYNKIDGTFSSYRVVHHYFHKVSTTASKNDQSQSNFPLLSGSGQALHTTITTPVRIRIGAHRFPDPIGKILRTPDAIINTSRMETPSYAVPLSEGT